MTSFDLFTKQWQGLSVFPRFYFSWRDSEIAQVLLIPLLSVRFQLGVRIRNCLFSSRVLSQSNKNLYLLGFSATELKLLIDQHAGLWLSTETSMNCFTLFYVLFGFHTTDKFPQSITGLETGTMTNSYQAKREKNNNLSLDFPILWVVLGMCFLVVLTLMTVHGEYLKIN